MIVAEQVVVPLDVPVETLYGVLSSVAPAWMTETKPGVNLALFVVGDKADTTQEWLVNLGEDPVRLDKDQLLSGLHPVEIQRPVKCDRSREPVTEECPVEILPMGLQEQVAFDSRAQFRDLLTEYQDISVN